MAQGNTANSKNEPEGIVGAAKIIMENWQRADVMQGAAEMAYYLLLSLIPILLVVVNLIPLLPFSSAEIVSFIDSSVPQEVGTILIPIVQDYMASFSGGAISFGLLAAIWSASNVISTLNRVLDEVYGVKETENVVIARILSVLIMIAILVLVGATVFAFVFGAQILNFVSDFFKINIPFIQGFLFARWLVLPVLLLIVTTVVYQFVPNHHLKIKYAFPGALFASVGLVLLSEFFTLITRFMGGKAITNATLGSFIGLMLFLYLANAILLFGALINTLVFELKNDLSVEEYETELQQREKRKKSKWQGYPDESKTILLKRKLHKEN